MAHILTLKGRVLYANGKPAQAVSVRVFDRDKPSQGNPDDELTPQPAVTDGTGCFSVPFDTNRNVEQTDPLTPYAQFTYQINTIERQFVKNFSFIPFFQEEVDMGHVVLPVYAPIQFAPPMHGFHFVNSFPGVPLPFDIPLERFKSETHGLCGGMAYGAADFVIYGRQIPAATQVPRKGSSLYNFLYGRLLDSFGPAFSNVFKLQNWLARPSDTVNGLQKLTYDEFKRVRNKLDVGQLVPLFVMLDRKALWNSHQVLAYRYVEHPDHTTDILVYDPNYPNDDRVAIRCTAVNVAPTSGTAITGFECKIINTAHTGTRLYSDCFAFFDPGYNPKFPPPRV